VEGRVHLLLAATTRLVKGHGEPELEELGRQPGETHERTNLSQVLAQTDDQKFPVGFQFGSSLRNPCPLRRVESLDQFLFGDFLRLPFPYRSWNSLIAALIPLSQLEFPYHSWNSLITAGIPLSQLKFPNRSFNSLIAARNTCFMSGEFGFLLYKWNSNQYWLKIGKTFLSVLLPYQ